MTLPEYAKLKRAIILAVGRTEGYNNNIASLKELFREDINSVRRFEQISTIGQLLNILEIRDVLTEDNVECLKFIVKKLPNSKELLNQITEYENCHVLRENEVYYVPTQSKTSQESFITASSVPLRRNMSATKQQRIFLTVVSDIGSYWRDLGRSLGVKECIIDDTDIQYKSLDEKATKIIQEFQAKADPDPDRWFFTLCEALEKTRRKDIVKNLHKVMSMNI